jgi:hypothetical protein
MAISMVVDGPLGRASRFDAQHLVGEGVDAWLIDLHSPVVVMLHGENVTMRSQFLLSVVRADRTPNTHAVALAPTAERFNPEWLGRGKQPTVICGRDLYGQHVLCAEFAALGDHTARAVGRAVAVGFAQGELPMQGRHVGLAFVRSVRMVALALSQVTFAPVGAGSAD